MIAKLAVAAVALLHVVFMYTEIVLWCKPAGRRIFGMSEEQTRQTAVLAANQGLDNGFLAAGLVWGLLHSACGSQIIIFFPGCVIIAGIFGAIALSLVLLDAGRL